MKFKNIFKMSVLMMPVILGGLMVTPDKTEAAWTLETLSGYPKDVDYGHWGSNGFSITAKSDNKSRLYIYGEHSNSASSATPTTYNLYRYKWNADKGEFEDGIVIVNEPYESRKDRFLYHGEINGWENGVYAFYHSAKIGGDSHSDSIGRQVTFSGFFSIGNGDNNKIALLYFDAKKNDTDLNANSTKLRIREATAQSESTMTTSTKNGLTFNVKGAMTVYDDGGDVTDNKTANSLFSFSEDVWHVNGDDDPDSVGSTIYLKSQNTDKDVWSTSDGTEYIPSKSKFRYGKSGLNLPAEELKDLPVGNYEFDYGISVDSGSHATKSIARERLKAPSDLPDSFNLQIKDGLIHTYSFSKTDYGNLNMSVKKVPDSWTLKTFEGYPNNDDWQHWGQNGFSLTVKEDGISRVYIYGSHTVNTSSSAPTTYQLNLRKYDGDKTAFVIEDTVNSGTYAETKNFLYHGQINDWDNGTYSFSHKAKILDKTNEDYVSRPVTFSDYITIGNDKNSKAVLLYYDKDGIGENTTKLRIRTAVQQSKMKNMTATTNNGITMDILGAMTVTDDGNDIDENKIDGTMFEFSKNVWHVKGDNNVNSTGSTVYLKSQSTGVDVWYSSVGTEYPTTAKDYRYGKSGINLSASTLKDLPLGNYEFDYGISVVSASFATKSHARDRLSAPETLPADFTLTGSDGGKKSFSFYKTSYGNLNITVKDASPPTANTSQTPSAWTNQNVVLNVTDITDLGGSEYKNTTLPNGQISTDTTIDYLVTTNGKYAFIISDGAGNKTTKTFDVTNIDKVSPTIDLSENPTSWTNQPVPIIYNAADDRSGVKNVTLPNNTSSNATGTYKASKNGSYTFNVVDNAGNTNSKTISIANIDLENPSGNFAPNAISWTNLNVTSTFTPSDTGGSGVSKWRYKTSTDNGANYEDWSGYQTSTSKAFTFSVTGYHKVMVEVIDVAGNIATITSGTYHIDKIVPSMNVKQNISDWTNQNVILTATGSDTGGSDVKQIQLPNGSIVTTVVNNVTATENGTLSFLIKDGAGNSYTKTHSVTNIDKILPSGNFAPSSVVWTNLDVTTTFTPSDTGGSGVSKWRYKISTDNGATYGDWSAYQTSASKAFNFTATGYHKVMAEVIDAAGNTATVTSGTYHIDKITPSLTTVQNISVWTNEDVILTAKGLDSGGSGVKQIKHPDGKIVTGYNTTFVVERNGNYEFIITDVAGNTFSKTHSVTNIDKIEPSGLFNPHSKTTWSKSAATTFTPSDLGGSKVKQWRYRTSDDNGATWGSWTSYINGETSKDIVFQESGKWIAQAEIYDNAGNISTVKSGLFNVDNVSPYAWSQTILTDRPTMEIVTIHLNLEDNLSGIKETTLPNGGTIKGESIDYPVSANGLYKFIIYDNAGNLYEHFVLVNNVDKTPPIAMNVKLIKNVTSNTYDVHVQAIDDSGIYSVETNTNKALTKDNGSETYSVTGLTTLPSSVTITNAAGGTTAVTFLSLPTYTYSSNASVIREDLEITFKGAKELNYELNGKEVGCATTSCIVTVNQNSDVSLIHNDTNKTSIVKLNISNIDKTIYDLTLTGKRNATGDSVTLDWSPTVSNPSLKCTSMDGSLTKLPNSKPFTFAASNTALSCVLSGSYNGQTLLSNEVTIAPIYQKPVTDSTPTVEFSKTKFNKVYEDYQISGEFYMLNGTRNNSETQMVPIPDNLK